MIIDQAKVKIQELVQKYERAKKTRLISKYTEEETKKDFIEPLFEALGWNVRDKREVSAEEAQSSGRLDYGFYLDGRPKFFLEAKSLRSDLNREEFANQAVRYSWNKGVTWAVLTDFENIIVFNAQEIEKSLGDKLFFNIPYDKFLDRFDKLWLLSKESFRESLLDKAAEEGGKKLQRVSVSTLLYKDLDKCREILTHDLSQWNKGVDKDLLDEGVQKLLDRLIFLRVAEDRGIEQPTLVPMLREWNLKGGKLHLYQSMVSRFREFDEIYNSNLFSPHPFEDWEEYSGATEKVINILYGKKGYYEYDFQAMSADVLGSVYENYLGYRLIKSKKGIVFSKDAGKRKEQGIYYTPDFIVDYIVKNTLVPVLNQCSSVSDLQKIKVLDPACGSGSFLIKALEVIYAKYIEFGNTGGVFTKIDILLNNIYGVDLDPQAVEIARLNLLISALDSRMKLPVLEKNIKNGNSLISGTEEELTKYFGKDFHDKKPFDWKEEFPEVFKQGGFDVIVGNPPWGAAIDEERNWFEQNFPFSSKSHKDTYKTFIDRSLSILNTKGIVGFIIPSAFLYQPKDEDVRFLISKYFYTAINLGEKVFRNVEAPCSILIINKGKKSRQSSITDLAMLDRDILPTVLGDEKKLMAASKSKKKVVIEAIKKNIYLKFDEVFFLKDAGIQYHRSGIGLVNKGGNDLYERIFERQESNFKSFVPTWYGKLINRYQITEKTDERFNLDYKKVLREKESVSFTKDVFIISPKILWRQTASNISAVIDTKSRWFRNTIQCAHLKPEYQGKVDIFYALAIFNSRLIKYLYRELVMESGRVFPQVKITYLKQLPFIIGLEQQQKNISTNAKKMLDSYKKLESVQENSNKWDALISDIVTTDKKIDEEVYELYGLTLEEVAIIEGKK